MKKYYTYNIFAYPYAVVNGTIDVPADEKDIKAYIEDNWYDIVFTPADLDFEGTDFEVDDEPIDEFEE